MTAILEVENLVKQFSDNIAVDGISFSIPKGVCFGLLGPNGAGKTTTIEMMEGILKPTSGQVKFEGHGLTSAYRQKVGIQFQQTAIQDFLTVKETLVMFAAFYEQTLPIDKIIDTCALNSILDRDTRKLSGGQKQRLLLALAILNNPDVVFLDEPTTGLDPQARRNFWSLIDRIKKENKTIILTTHYMDEAESLCDELVIMDKGKILEQGSPTALLNKHFDGVIISMPKSVAEELDKKKANYQINNNRLDIQTDSVDTKVRQMLDWNLPLDDMQIRSPNLEDLFIQLTGHQLRG